MSISPEKMGSDRWEQRETFKIDDYFLVLKLCGEIPLTSIIVFLFVNFERKKKSIEYCL